MPDIKFNNDYGLSDPSPFWMIFREDGRAPAFKHETLQDAETEAVRLAKAMPGDVFHILAVVATVQTSPEIFGQRFDPKRVKPRAEVAAPPQPEPAPFPEFAEVDEAPL
jgi:hypothetical protein